MRSLLIICALLAFGACSDNDGPDTDSGMTDVGMSDTGGDDASGDDAGGDDAGGDDAGGDDAGGDAGGDDAGGDDAGGDDAGGDAATDTGDPCDAITLGDTCSGADECTAPYVCDDDFGRCVPPGGRGICGGIAGAVCEDADFDRCTLVSGASGGPCLSAVETMCVCRDHADFYSCPE